MPKLPVVSGAEALKRHGYSFFLESQYRKVEFIGMSVAELVALKVQSLPEDKPREVLDFTEWLIPKEAELERLDLQAAREALKEGPPIPYEQIRQGLGLDK